jgi:hypothetical protein
MLIAMKFTIALRAPVILLRNHRELEGKYDNDS